MRNIVIVGAGFAGLRTALRLEKRLKALHDEWRVILIDKNSYHTFTPALYEAAAAYNLHHIDDRQIFEGLIGGAVCLPYRDIFVRKDITFVNSFVREIDFVSKVLETKEDDSIPFDYLILALGSAATYFGVKDAEKCCYNIKTIEGALKTRRRIKDIFSRKKDNINIVVVGGGFTGIEVVAEIAIYANHLARDYKIDKSQISVSLMEAGDKILAQAHPALRRLVVSRLKNLGIDVRVNTKITETMPGCVLVGGAEKCDADIIIWNGGTKGPALFEKFEEIELGKRGRVIVDEFMRVRYNKNVFAIGDNALFVDESGSEAPATVFIAGQQADIAAHNILADIRGGNMKKYKIYLPGYATSVGGRYAVDRIFGVTFSGFFGWSVKKFINLRYFFSILPIKKALSLWLRELRLFTRND